MCSLLYFENIADMEKLESQNCQNIGETKIR